MTTSTAPAIGQYTVLRRLGDGGMARALLARGVDGRDVVLKIPLEPSAQMTTKLRDEAQAGMRVRHANVVETLDFFVDDGHAVLVLEFIDGCAMRDLRQLNRRPNPLPPVAVATIGRSIAEALAAIHAAVDEHGAPLHMLHRDVTPSNILIGRDGVPKLIDLGIARSAENEAERTSAGLVKGTLRYVSPELLRGAGYTPASDLWSLGVCLFEAALGRMMVKGDPVTIFKALMGDHYRDLRPHEQLDPDLAAAIFALVAPEELRLRNAKAAAAIFTRLEQALVARDPSRVTGQHWLQSWVPWATPLADADDDEPLLPPASPPPPRLVLGDDRHGTAATIAMPAVDIAPGRVVALSPAPTSTPAPAFVPTAPDLDVLPTRLDPVRFVDPLPTGTPTLQVPQWQPVEAAIDVDLGSLGDGPSEGSWDEATAPMAATLPARVAPIVAPSPENTAPATVVTLVSPTPVLPPGASNKLDICVPTSAMARPTLQMPVSAIAPRAPSTEASEPRPAAPSGSKPAAT